MKKTYKVPTALVIEVNAEELIADSPETISICSDSSAEAAYSGGGDVKGESSNSLWEETW